MEKRNQARRGGSSSSSSFTMDLFGPKHSPPPPPAASSSAVDFDSLFGPSSTGLAKDSSHSKYVRNYNSANRYGNAKYRVAENKTQRSKGESGSKYQNEVVKEEQPCNMSSSLYYGGQDQVYSPHNTTHSTTNYYHTFKKDGGLDDSSGNNTNDASRGNWWQGSLYY